jgi:dTDP-4-amino-4,6-dideoxygalactose transaminase
LFVALLPLERMAMSREELILALRARNIGATIHYQPLHTMPLYRGDVRAEPLPICEDIAKRCITLPIGASMTLADADDVISSIGAVLK